MASCTHNGGRGRGHYGIDQLALFLPSVAQVQIQAGLEDDHVVKIYDTISLPDKNEMFIVMEYCEGGNLLQWIQRTRRHKLLNQMVRERD